MHIHTGNHLVDLFLGAIAMFILSIFLIVRGTSGKEDFEKSTGRIVHLGTTYEHLSHRHGNKIRYLLIDSYRYPFEIFIGHDRWDFSPKYERIDSLSVGDTITVYYVHDNELGVNKLLQFIDRKEDAFYVKGSLDLKFGLSFMCFSFVLACTGVYLYWSGKLNF